jgi:zinc protease
MDPDLGGNPVNRPLLVAAIAAIAGCPKPAPTTGAAPHVPFEHYELENGLDVILAPDDSTPIVYTNVWYHVGSRDERAGLTGFAHLFEHLMFQGSKNAPGEYFGPLQEVGADVNGTTSFDRTNYFEELPAQHLPRALFLEADRMGSLLDVLDQAKLDNQRDVVRNERRQRYEVPPYGEAYKDLYAAAFPVGHPYHHMPIGSHEDLQAADLDAVGAFFRTWYVPNNASLVIAGDFDADVAKGLVEQYFGGIPRGADPQRRTEPAPVVLDQPVRLVQEDDVPEDKVWIAWHSPPSLAPGDADLDLLASVLTNGEDSRLYQALVKDSRVAKDVGAYQGSLALGSLFIISATASEGHTTDEVVAGIDRVLADVLGPNPPTVEEVDGARTAYEVGFFEGIETISGKGDMLNRYFMHTGDPGYIAQDLARYQTATPASVLEWGQRVFGPNRVTLQIRPAPTEAAPTEGGAP